MVTGPDEGAEGRAAHGVVRAREMAYGAVGAYGRVAGAGVRAVRTGLVGARVRAAGWGQEPKRRWRAA